MKLKKGDNVLVVRGKDKGKQGKVDQVFSKEGKVLVENINLFKRHLKARLQNQKSEIVTISKPLPVSNVALVCPKCNLPTRIGYKSEKGKKLRICRKCQAEI